MDPSTSPWARSETRSGEGELRARLDHDARQGAVYPARAGRQQDRGRADQEGFGIAPGRRRPPLEERASRAEQALADLDDGRIARAQTLLGAVDDGPLALLYRLILDTEARNAAEHLAAVDGPVHAVVVVAVQRGADVAVGLRGRRREIADVRPLALEVNLALLGSKGAIRMPGHHPVDDLRVVHGHPDVRLDDPLVPVRGRHGVEGQEELRDPPIVPAVRPAPARTDQDAVVGIHDLEARGAIGRLHRLAHSEARAVQLARDLAVRVVQGRVEEGDVAGVDAALEGLEPVALLDALRDERVDLRQERPLQRGQGRGRARRPHVGPDHSPLVDAGVGDVTHLRGEARLRGLAGHLQTLPVQAVLPAVIDAAHARVLHAAEGQRGKPVRAELADEPGLAQLAAIDHEALAQELDALDLAAGLDLARLHDGHPVLAQERAHRRPPPDLRQEKIVFMAQHGVWAPLAGSALARRLARPVRTLPVTSAALPGGAPRSPLPGAWGRGGGGGARCSRQPPPRD